MSIALNGRFLHADGSPAAGLAYVLVGGGRTLAGTTDVEGRWSASALPPPVSVCLLDGFLLARRAAAEKGTSQQEIDGASPDVFVWGPPRGVALVRPPDPLSEAAARALASIDVVGPYDDGLLEVTLAPRKVAELRAEGFEVLVIDPDANQYATRVGETSPEELAAWIDERLADARAWQARVPGGAAAVGVDPPIACG